MKTKKKYKYYDFVCMNCGNQFKSRHPENKPKFCSQKCHGLKTKKDHSKKCVVCGVVFHKKQNMWRDKTCSRKCCYELMVNTKSKREGFGFHKNTNGYKRSHLNWKYEHVLVAEKIIGRELLENEVVHHINQDKNDNSEENLIVLTKSEHSKVHCELKKTKELRKKNILQNFLHKIRKTSTVRIDVTSEGWKAYPKNRQEYTQLIPLITIAEALGLEVHIVDRESKSNPSSANA